MLKIEVEAERIEQAYNALKDTLTDKEREVITRFYGIGNMVRHSLEEIAKMYSVTRERIRQIKADALKKLDIKLKGR